MWLVVSCGWFLLASEAPSRPAVSFASWGLEEFTFFFSVSASCNTVCTFVNVHEKHCGRFIRGCIALCWRKHFLKHCWDEGAGAPSPGGTHTHTHTQTLAGFVPLTGPAPSTRSASPEHLANTSGLLSRLALLEAHWRCFSASGTNVFRGAWRWFNRCSKLSNPLPKNKKHRVLLYSLCLMRWWR